MRAGRNLWLAVALAASACTTSASSRRGTPLRGPAEPTGPKRVKLAVLKVDSEQFPELAKAINNQLRDAQVKGVDDYFISKVTLEVVQLSIECVEPTPQCYAQVGRSLSAQQLLVPRLSVGAAKRGKKREHAPSVTVMVTLMDAEAGTALHVAEKQFKSEGEAIEGLAEVVQEATGQAVAAKPQVKAGP